MANYKLLTGCFAGRVVAEGACILDVSFFDLDQDLKSRILDFIGYVWGDMTDPDEVTDPDYAERMEEAKRIYEESWDSIETSKPADLLPYSLVEG